MSTLIYDGDFDTATRVSPFRTSAPFPGDRDNYIGEADYIQKFDEFKPLQLGAAYEGNSLYRLVEESALVMFGPGVGKWTRKFAKQPASRIEWESYAWRRPGFTGDTINAQFTLASQPTLNSSGNLLFTITTNRELTGHGLTASDSVVIRYNAYIPGIGTTTRYVTRQIVGIVSQSQFTIGPIVDRVATNGFISVQPGGISRPVETFVVASRLEVEYHHVGGIGDTFKTPSEIPIANPDPIVSADNAITDSYGSTTTPSVTTYLATVASGTWIVAEATIIRRWVGNYYEVSTRKVRAQ